VPHTACIAIGSNLGDREAVIRGAVASLQAHPEITVIAVAPLLANKAVGGPQGSPDFLNTAACLETSLSPHELLAVLFDIERKHGRVRDAGERDAPRTLDLDLLMHGSTVLRDEILELPHPRMTQRRFVLEPLAAVAP